MLRDSMLCHSTSCRWKLVDNLDTDNTTDNSRPNIGPNTVPSPETGLPSQQAGGAGPKDSPWVVPILVAGHQEEERNIVTMALADAGYAVHQVADGMAALNFLMCARPPLLVVADDELPEISGFQLAQLLSLKPAPRSRYSAIVLTGSLRAALQRSTHRLLDAITLEVLVKPFHLSELLMAVEMATERLAGHQRMPHNASNMRDRGDIPDMQVDA